jgi:xylose isomerase
MVRRAAAIPDVTGIELVGSWDITGSNVKEMKQLLADHRLQCVSIIPDHFSQKHWGNGSFTSRDPEIRRKAVETTKEMIDIAVEMNCSLLNLWPGQDGYDYPFQSDFLQAREWLNEAIRECADYRKEIRLSLEYKLKEPRTHSYLARAADTFLLAQSTERKNVGVTIDFGHALMAYENVAESAAMLAQQGKLFHMHFNDNYRYWDDDMVVGSIHTVEYLELLYWLRRMNYDGWYSMDLYPYREDAKEAISESILWLKSYEACIDRYGFDKITEFIERGSATEINSELRKIICTA